MYIFLIIPLLIIVHQLITFDEYTSNVNFILRIDFAVELNLKIIF